MKSHRCRRLIAAAGASLAPSAGTVACGSASKPAATAASPPVLATSTPTASAVADRIPDVVEQVQPSIVTVFAQADAGGDAGVGSGVVYRRDGIILTNNHVVDGAVADELLESGRARHAYIGVQPGQLTPQIAGELHVTGQGVVAYAVAPDGPAGQAGLRPGDVLTAVGAEKIAGVEELSAALRRHQPGETVGISYVRDGHQGIARLQIVDRPS